MRRKYGTIERSLKSSRIAASASTTTAATTISSTHSCDSQKDVSSASSASSSIVSRLSIGVSFKGGANDGADVDHDGANERVPYQPFNMRRVNLGNFPISHISHRSTFRSQTQALDKAVRGSISDPKDSLEAMRKLLQAKMNAEIQAVVDKYAKKFFKPAVENVKCNKEANNNNNPPAHNHHNDGERVFSTTNKGSKLG